MSTPIRTAVLGYGFAGRIFHSPFVHAVPGLELAAIVQRHGDNAATDYPGTRILRSVDEAFGDAAIDLIVVATPNDSHVEMARRALEAGKHVVVDKPIAGSSAEVLELMALAKKQGKLLAPFHNRRFDGDFLTVKKLADRGQAGADYAGGCALRSLSTDAAAEYLEGSWWAGEWLAVRPGAAPAGSGAGVVWCANVDHGERSA